jgi:hypothetical protein
MPTIVGTDQLSSLVRHQILPVVTDNIYGNIALLARLLSANKRTIQGGRHIEAPLLYQKANVGGAFTGNDVLSVAEFEDTKNAAWGWKRIYVPVTINSDTLIMADSALAVVDYIKKQMKSAEMYMADLLAGNSIGIWSAGTNVKGLDGLDIAIDSTGTYGGLSRSTNSWWAAYEDTTSSQVLTFGALQTVFSNCQVGGKHPTSIWSRRDQYNRYWLLNQAAQAQQMLPQGHDEIMASAGFTNLSFNNVPWFIDDNVPLGADSTNSQIFMPNEEFIELVVSPRGDFYFKDFQEPVDMASMTARLEFAGNLISTSSRVHGKLSDVRS